MPNFTVSYFLKDSINSKLYSITGKLEEKCILFFKEKLLFCFQQGKKKKKFRNNRKVFYLFYLG